MADVGGSSTAHIQYTAGADVERALINWGNWQASIENPLKDGIAIAPAFKEYVAGYRSASEDRQPEDIEAAESLEKDILELPDKYVYCLICNYVLIHSSRTSAKMLTYLSKKTGVPTKCTHTTYSRWLDQAVILVGEKAVDSITMLR